MKMVSIVLAMDKDEKIDRIRELVKGFAKLLDLDEFEEEINESYMMEMDDKSLISDNTLLVEYYLSGNVPDDINKSSGIEAVKSLYNKYKKVIEKNFGKVIKAKYVPYTHSYTYSLELENNGKTKYGIDISVDKRILVWSVEIRIHDIN